MKLALILLLILPLALAAEKGQAGREDAAAPSEEALQLPVVLPEHPTDEEDAYLCTAVQLPDRPLKLVGITPTSDERVVHHMLLFGCKAPAQTAQVWNCRMASVCASGGGENVLYGWGKNAPAVAVPEGAGFSVGPGTSIRTVVLQMHYLHGRPANDTSGVVLHLSPTRVPNSAGMVAFAASFAIPPQAEKLVENGCCYSGWEPLHGFATRVHTHALGREVYLDRLAPGPRTQPARVVGLDPQKPQGFYPVTPHHTILPGDRLAMACRFNSSGVDRTVYAGHTHADEMCNLYLMLYSQLPVFVWCLDGREWVELDGAGGLPPASTLQPETTIWQPPAALEVAGAKAGKKGFPVGQVSGVASAGDGTVWVFHRGDAGWASNGSVVLSSSKGRPGLLQGPAVLQVEQDTGSVLRSWGAGKFGLPHMISLDWEGNVWVTDVVLHQAVKFSPEGKQLLALGTRLQEGTGPKHFCRPTQVAVARSGNIYVADGYCNNRVAEFDASGKWLRDYALPVSDEMEYEVPHSVVVHECRGRLLVAGREAGRVHAFQLGTAKHLGLWDLSAQWGLPYALALGPYGSVLALTWYGRGEVFAKVWVVALAGKPGEYDGSWEVPGVQEPHDLALAPAPLELTGAGERLLAVVVAETKMTRGDNLHKFVFVPQGAQLSNVSAGRSVAADEGGEEAAQQQQQQPEGIHASHIGHVMLKPVGDGSDGGSGEATSSNADGEAEQPTHIGHSMVKPVEDEKPQEGDRPKGAPAVEAPGEDGVDSTAGSQEDKQALSGKAAASSASGKQPVPQQKGQAAESKQQVQQTKEQRESHAADADKLDSQQLANEEAALIDHEEAEQQHSGKGDPSDEIEFTEAAGEEAAAAGARDDPPVQQADAAAASQGWHPKQQLLLKSAVAQPWLLGVVFLGAAAAAWHGLHRWRLHSAGYQHPPGHDHTV